MAQIWAKFNKNERNVSFGAAIVIIGWLVGVVSPGLGSTFGVGFLSALGAAAVIVIYYLKYAPNQNIQWPAPIPTIVVVISALIAIFAILGLVQILAYLSFAGFFGIYLIALLAITAGAVLMFFGAWQEYQATAAERAAAAPPATAAPATQPAPAAPAPAPVESAPPPAAPAASDADDGAPPA